MIRSEMQSFLKSLMPNDTINVYFQPPENINLSYPCVIYKRKSIVSKRASNIVYFHKDVYEVSILTTDPDDELFDIFSKLTTAKFLKSYVSNGLYHHIFDVY